MKCLLGLAKANVCKLQPFYNTSNRIWTARVMAGDMCRQHFQNITRLLHEFENKPKKIEGNLITEWFNVGENIFEEFYKLGISLKWDISKIKGSPGERDVVSAVTANLGWLQSFVSVYPALRVQLDGGARAAAACRVRSGLELLLRLLALDGRDAADALRELGELDEFDHRLKTWTEGYRPDFFPGDVHPDTPDTHWWWF